MKVEAKDFLGLDHMLDEAQAHDVADRMNEMIQQWLSESLVVQGRRFEFVKGKPFFVWRPMDTSAVISASHEATLINIKEIVRE